MNIVECLKVALRGLSNNKMRTALTMLGIIIGVGVVILVSPPCSIPAELIPSVTLACPKALQRMESSRCGVGGKALGRVEEMTLRIPGATGRRTSSG